MTAQRLTRTYHPGMVKNGGRAVLWAAFSVAFVGVLVTVMYDWLPFPSRVAIAIAVALMALLCGWRSGQLWPRGETHESPVDDVSTPPSPSPRLGGSTDDDETELVILQMFVEFRGKHTVEDVAKRMRMNAHLAGYHLDHLCDKHLITHSYDEYRNARPVFIITREGRDLLVRLNLVK